ncbi:MULTISPECIES: DUF975 family protein [unclassified Paludibacterium]|uniref:DUF975 family protein n=1 Tax=unclassified Paludibacterium TaxID=2618429 RepID=UPI001C047DFA|nr:DUF975 family protein [Paludibacterium sp. B53371]BEV70871.1 DUF975 family protein [Paludibacterium sp. THUN1379]
MSQISMTDNARIMAEARAALSGRWKMAVGATAILLGIELGLSLLVYLGLPPYSDSFVDLLIKGPLELGFALFYLQLLRGGELRFSQLFSGFERYLTGLAAYLLMVLFILLWALLLIIPGVIAALSYSMTFYLLVDEPQLSAREALRKSKIMMIGNKWKFFCLGCRFIGWFLLGLLTLGIGLLWVIPYLSTSLVRFYQDIRDVPPAVGSADPDPGLSYGFDDQ